LVVSHTWSIWNANNAKIKNWFVIHDFPMDPNETGSSRIKIAWKLYIPLWAPFWTYHLRRNVLFSV
jgi:DNA modification methylase